MTRAAAVFAAALAIALPLSLLAGRGGLSAPVSATELLILTELRLPRAVLAVFVGAGLGMAGAAMQGYLRNPLADPGLFGIAPGAALGAVTALLAGAPWWAVPPAALAGAAAAMALLALVAGRTPPGLGRGIALFTLAGLMISSLAGALTALVISLAPNAFVLSEIVMWLNGALTDRSWREVAIAAPLILSGCALLLLTARALDALTLGEAVARSLGVVPGRLLWLLVAGVGLTVGAGVAVAGIIGFVGLIVPHLVRPLTDRRPSALLLPAALAGGLLVLIADTAVRILPLMVELRLGIVLSFIGAPFFLWLLLRLRRGWA
ncbi:iron ABC transporter permease [Erythrobacteraceae bacterium CFH 75059]|uniref:FecCD family ABC transporter permease n=1 Tax=Qipengyuania thermophila TaxID=2509361 RepID=UPI001021C8D9|nr:iron ABC transporter permease [Qipengyuania thermophila]TCD05440.1 iron ABC transporter permease [Erythrobacteraceae bacterium CFH 75059]